MAYFGERVLRKCYDCRIQFDARVDYSKRVAKVYCPRCGKPIKVNSVSTSRRWDIGSIRNY